MNKLLKFFRRFISLNEAAYYLLIYVGMNSVLLGIELVVRGTSVEVLRILILLGILAGWLLSRSRLKFWQAVILAVLGGLIVTTLHIGGIGAALFDLLRSSLGYLLGLIFRRAPDPDQLVFLLSVIQTRAAAVVSNLSLWVNDLMTGFTVYNQVTTLHSWGFILWILSSWFAWTTYRRDQPLWGVLPAGTLLAVLMTYTLQKRFTLVLLLGVGLILIGMVNHEVREREWKNKNVKGTDIVRERVILAVLGFSLYTMAFSGLMPSIRISPIADRFERLVYGDGEAADGEGTSGGISVGDFSNELYSIQRFAGLPRQKLIGSGPELAKRVVMIVSYPTSSFVEGDLPKAARYWRSYSYDRYTGSGWQSSPTVEVSYQPGQEITGVYSDSVEVITQEYRLGNAVRGTLFSAGPPVTLDHEALVSWRTVVEEGSNGGSRIVGMEDIFAVTLDTILYQVRSQVSTATDDQLRTAEGVYPDWVGSRYLDLPDTVPQRVLDLAEEITRDQPTGYDQAKAIESFLRAYPYTLELPAPPIDRDVADYFLFDLQTGYCDYYATAMVVLSRAMGMPSRVVVGYVGGQYDEENDYYLVSEAEAHTWVEIYFNGYGWVPFEPTAARGLIDDQDLALPLPPELANLPQAVQDEEKGEFPWWQLGAVGLLAAVISLAVWNRVDLIRLRTMNSNNLVVTLYLRLFRYGRWMGLGHRKSDTLYEFKEQLGKTFQELDSSSRVGTRLREGLAEIDQLTDFAVQVNYSGMSLDRELNAKIIKIWTSLRAKLRLLVWRGFWKAQAERLTFREKDQDRLELLEDGAADGTR